MNKRYPGRANYTGPKSGFFLLVHHDLIVGHSHDIYERLEFIDNYKLRNERAWRRHCMVYVRPRELPAEVVEKIAAERKARSVYDHSICAWPVYRKVYYALRTTADEYAKELEVLLTKYVPDHTWDGEELVFK